MDLSIIVPVYNTPQKDLEKCLSSINELKGIEYEVIIVDDGSAKETNSFCQWYTKNHDRFTCYTQTNQGVSAARNTGIGLAQGEYLMFVDADDELIAGNIKTEYFSEGADIIFFDHELFENGKTTIWKVFEDTSKQSYPPNEFIMAACLNRVNSSCSRLLRRKWLEQKGIRFDESMVIAEDAQFMFTAIVNATNMQYAGCTVYRYNHSNDNGNRRLLKYPDQVIENLIRFYHNKMRALEECFSSLVICEEEMVRMKTAVSAQIVEDLFNSIGTLIMAKKALGEVKGKALAVSRQIWDGYNDMLLPKTKMKCLLLCNNQKVLIQIYAYIRSVYLKCVVN